MLGFWYCTACEMPVESPKREVCPHCGRQAVTFVPERAKRRPRDPRKEVFLRRGEEIRDPEKKLDRAENAAAKFAAIHKLIDEAANPETRTR